MPSEPAANRVLVKLRPGGALRAAASGARLEPLYQTPGPPNRAFAAAATEPQWFVAEMREPAATPWDLAHARVADQLGVSEDEVVFAEPDLVHDIFPDDSDRQARGLAVGESCEATPQDSEHGKAVGPDAFGWHLRDEFSQLGSARDAVAFSDPRTRIAHIDTGYYRAHVSVPEHVLRNLERNFVEGDVDPGSSEDPDNRVLILDNSGHGTGTLSIVAGGRIDAQGGVFMGGAPNAEVLPLRVADSVVLLRTSALARAFRYAVEQRCDVVTLSMGGVPSQAWAEAVNDAYEAGLCICAAAGNHVGIGPPRRLVYPARYARVIAVCGVMADGRPYASLKDNVLEGSFGPESAMKTAIASYTPNIPWAVFGCPTVIRLNGEGTSSATPQVAAAVALWFEKYKSDLPRDWRRIEAVRHALFTTAKQQGDREHLGNGILQARAALEIRPVLALPKSPAADNSFALFRLLTGLGIAEQPPRERMFNLELAQRWLVNPDLEDLVPDPAAVAALAPPDMRRVMDAIIADKGASLALRKQVALRYPVVTGQSAPTTPETKDVVPEPLRACDDPPPLADPPFRRIRVYAMDPSFSTRLETVEINELVLKVRWERLEPGPRGEYLDVQDIDATKRPYEPVDLNRPQLLAQDGWAPSEGNPQFHQQMAYAVAMKTIEHFERALGRPVLWRPRPNPIDANDDSQFVPRLVIRPHALRQANAFYSPQEVALLFGYFEARGDDPGDHVPGSRVYSCLSHDIVAHETTHAILDGMHRRFNEASNVDVLAFHEGFADIVALMQHFTMGEILRQEIARTRGDIEAESILGSLAVQFGRASGARAALRDAIGRFDENNVWRRIQPDPTALQKQLTPHARGALLVAAVFDAFLAIYKVRTADLLRIATGGTGIRPAGAIHPDVVQRFADEAAKAASHVLTMCVRALDYLPPVDVTFFDYLRALITADYDIVADDRFNYRVAFVEAFRRRGIQRLRGAEGPEWRPISVDTLRWQGGLNVGQLLERLKIEQRHRKAVERQYEAIVTRLRRYADACFYVTDREQLFTHTREQRRLIHEELKRAFAAVPQFAIAVGLNPERPFEVHALRRALRVGPDGRHVPQAIVALTQSQVIEEPDLPPFVFRGGSTLVVDLSESAIKYQIGKGIMNDERRERVAAFARTVAGDPLRALLYAPDRAEPFAALHAFGEDRGL